MDLSIYDVDLTIVDADSTLAHAFYVFYIRYANVLQAPVKPFWGNLVGGKTHPNRHPPMHFLLEGFATLF